MKKSIIILVFLLLAACARDKSKDYIVVSCKPAELIVKELTKNLIPVKTILPSGVSPHSYSPTPMQIAEISNAQLVIFIAGNLDSWVVLPEMNDKLELMSLLPFRHVIVRDISDPESIKKGFQYVDGTYDDNADPHFWLDPICVKSVVPELTAKIIEQFPQYEDTLLKNEFNFCRSLEKFEGETEERLIPVKGKSVILFHPSFQYYLKRMGFDYCGSIEKYPGKEPTPEYIKMLAEKAKAKKIACIFGEKQFAENTVKAVAAALGVRYALLDPLGAGSSIKTYFDLISYNNDIILKNL